MAYTHTQYEVMVAKDASLASATDIGDWAPGYVPHKIVSAAIVFTTAVDATGATAIDKRPTAGSDSSRTALDTINYTTTLGAQGLIVYWEPASEVIINPGEEIVFEVTDATPSAGNGHLVLLVEPVWEQPANNSDMSETT